MLLTPIHVRGRRKIRDEDDDAPKPIPSGPRGGRPLLSPQAKLSSSQTRSHKRARLLTATPLDKPRKKKQSLLESLPNELIEKIFLHSLNVNLARSSPILAAAVSTERIYRALILLAFWDDSTELSASPYSRESRDAIFRTLRPLDYAPISLAQRKDLQTAILHCRWCTVPRILDQLPDLMNLVIQQHWLGAGISMAEEQEKLLDRVLNLEDDANVFEGFETINTTPDTSTPAPTKNYTLTINPSISMTITNHSIEQETTHPFLSPLIIPDKYLRGSTGSDSAPATPSSSFSDDGFTPALVTYLEIHRLSLGFDSVTLPLRPPKHPLILSRPCLQQGIHTAIVSNNLPALLTLLKLDEFYFRDQEPVIPYALSAGHFRTAVRLAPRNPEFFQALVRANAESVPADDPEITEWAMRLQDPFGRWLLELMLRLPEQAAAAKRNPVQNSVFWMGRANADRRELASMYLRDVLGGVERLESWMGEMHVPLSLSSS
ncbi:hypothetical protein ASPACDRAFT_34839 [Aspergillus aculeatus ATCC 16872]|uniref:Uncharacterized protein n=1 Tax=Aspergillus aculeatus (strain ATCC 16872 / CBS 172.66 / WB 5094) TaxID=690307 RepID=A0A1L9WJM8_ASPA1|nr:uncharacterized protein ASPACDRAFT_34839 [Aspergillus aculeatus ATCC 16872]OJJ96361.1 hypothetical protein ASPACDRAFT_34839 [Aspergillus aculeatus ATCC 16872]